MIKANKVNIQITLNKDSLNKLEQIQNNLKDIFNFDITKSQAIEYLINNYLKPKEITKATKVANTVIDYSPIENLESKIIQLKQKLNISYTKLSILTGVNTSTLKKYAKGIQNPTETNKELLLKAFKKYDIK